MNKLNQNFNTRKKLIMYTDTEHNYFKTLPFFHPKNGEYSKKKKYNMKNTFY